MASARGCGARRGRAAAPRLAPALLALRALLHAGSGALPPLVVSAADSPTVFGSVRVVTDPSGAMTCVTLQRACLTVSEEVRSACPDTRKCATRPFRLDLFGPAAADEAVAIQWHQVPDATHSFGLRHLEADTFVHGVRVAGGKARVPRWARWPPIPPPAARAFANGSLGAGGARSRDPPALLWPKFALAHGAHYKYTLLPLAQVLAFGALPSEIGLAYWTHARALEPLRRAGTSFCALEGPVQNLSQCASGCHERLRVCRLEASAPTVRAGSYVGMHELALRLGLPDVRAEPPALGSAAEPRQLRVLFALRTGRRYVANTAELLSACAEAPGGRRVGGWRLRCHAAALGPPRTLAHAYRLVRRADVFVAMHGGDVIHGLLMRPGRTTIEVVNCGFHLAAPSWLDENRMRMGRGVRHVRLFARPPAGVAPARTVLDGWNENASVPWASLERVLAAVISRFEIDRIPPLRAPRDRPRGARNTPPGAPGWQPVDCAPDGACARAPLPPELSQRMCDDLGLPAAGALGAASAGAPPAGGASAATKTAAATAAAAAAAASGGWQQRPTAGARAPARADDHPHRQPPSGGWPRHAAADAASAAEHDGALLRPPPAAASAAAAIISKPSAEVVQQCQAILAEHAQAGAASETKLPPSALAATPTGDDGRHRVDVTR